MRRRPRPFGVALLAVLSIPACGRDPVGAPPTLPSPPDVAGTYTASTLWTLQVRRTSDGFQKTFTCSGYVTLAQGPARGGEAPLTGFAVVGGPCEDASFGLAGTVASGGAVYFTTNGPRPTEGPCPGGVGVAYSGQVASGVLSARGVAIVVCPQYGEHVYNYVIYGPRS